MIGLQPDELSQLFVILGMSDTPDNTRTALRSQPPVLMNEREIAVFIGLSERSVRHYTEQRVIPVIRVGRRKIYRRDAVLSALEALET